jgi:hypothetical protein
LRFSTNGAPAIEAKPRSARLLSINGERAIGIKPRFARLLQFLADLSAAFLGS